MTELVCYLINRLLKEKASTRVVELYVHRSKRDERSGVEKACRNQFRLFGKARLALPHFCLTPET